MLNVSTQKHGDNRNGTPFRHLGVQPTRKGCLRVGNLTLM